MSEPTLLFIWQGGWHGGAERITLELAKFAKQHGTNVTIGVYAKDEKTDLNQLVVPVSRIVPTSFRPLIASIVWRQKHAHRFNAVYTHKVGLWKTPHNKLFVHEAADLKKYQSHIKNPFKKLAALVWRVCHLNLTLKKADIVFSATQETTKYLEQNNIAKEKIKPSASFYNQNVFKFSSRKLAKPYQLCFIGNHKDPRKNISMLQHFLLGEENFNMQVIGGEKRSPDKNFHYHGYVTEEKIKDILVRSHVFVMPSQSEGFSIALLEALATGIPCLVHENSINQGLAGTKNLISFKNDQDFIKQMLIVLSNYSRYNVPDPSLSRFSRQAVLSQEYNTIKKSFY